MEKSPSNSGSSHTGIDANKDTTSTAASTAEESSSSRFSSQEESSKSSDDKEFEGPEGLKLMDRRRGVGDLRTQMSRMNCDLPANPGLPPHGTEGHSPPSHHSAAEVKAKSEGDAAGVLRADETKGPNGPPDDMPQWLRGFDPAISAKDSPEFLRSLDPEFLANYYRFQKELWPFKNEATGEQKAVKAESPDEEEDSRIEGEDDATTEEHTEDPPDSDDMRSEDSTHSEEAPNSSDSDIIFLGEVKAKENTARSSTDPPDSDSDLRSGEPLLSGRDTVSTAPDDDDVIVLSSSSSGSNRSPRKRRKVKEEPSTRRKNSREKKSTAAGMRSAKSTKTSDPANPGPVDNDQQFLVERIVEKFTEDGEDTYVVVWKGWSLEESTPETHLQLVTCPHMLEEFKAYDGAITAVMKTLQAEGETPDRINAPLLSEASTESEKRTAKAWWHLKGLEREWNQVLRGKDDDPVSGLIRVDHFFEEHLAKRPSRFQYIAKSIYSSSARAVITSLPRAPDGCTCNCRDGICSECSKNKDEEATILDGNRIILKDPAGALSRSYCAVYCSPRHPCSHPKTGRHQGYPERKVPLLVTFRPKVNGYGVYVLEDLPQHTLILPYLGHVQTEPELLGMSKNYQFGLKHGVVVDAAEMGNEARFVNHSCSPNAGILNLYRGTGSRLPKLWIVSLREIKKGEELLIDYHPSHAFKPKPPPPGATDCFCGSPNCRGKV